MEEEAVETEVLRGLLEEVAVVEREVLVLLEV
jgi:hypothetical protein